LKEKISKTNENLELLNRRLDEIQMSDRERLRAKAQLARADAVAELVFAAFRSIGRLFKATAHKPARPHRPATHAG
jgi:hypothetical protein